MPSAVPPFRKKAIPSVYRISNADSWYYGDIVGYSRVVNALVGMRIDQPHLVLSDRKKPRFVLGYDLSPSGFLITTIQRVRTEYRIVRSRGVEKMEWLREKENASQQKLAHSLGMHPAEFLLNEFIYTHRRAILSGQKIWLRVMVTSREGQHDSIYGPLIDRFFKKRPVEKGTQWLGASNYKYELSLDKRRVREALGLPPLKK